MRKQIKMAFAALALVAAMGGNLSAKGAKNNGISFSLHLSRRDNTENLPYSSFPFLRSTHTDSE